MAKQILTLVAGYLVLFVWAGEAVAGFITADFRGLEYVSPVMLILAGYLFGVEIIRKGRTNGKT
jgi:hypothetical protein